MRTPVFRMLVCMTAALLWVSLADAQEGPKTPTPTPAPGPSVPGANTPSPSRNQVNISGSAYLGEVAPDFELDASNSHPVKLSRMRGDWVVLVFAERRGDVTDLASHAADLRALGGVFLAVCDEKQSGLLKAQERNPLPFTVASDFTGEVSAMYGVYDRVHSTTLPGFFVLDRRGVVHLAVVGQQLPPDDILELARLTITSTH